MATLKSCCATGSLHTGTPTGTTTTLHNTPVYIASPPQGTTPKGVVVIIPDAFGWTLPNNRILADCYAEKGGFVVYLPEFMDGWALPADVLQSLTAFSAPGLWAKLANLTHFLYLLRHLPPFMLFNRPAVARPRIASFLSALKTQTHPVLPIGTAGFCWGGKYVTELCWDAEMNRTRDGERVTVCGFTAHPSMLAYPGDVERVRLPLSVAAAEVDEMMSAENAKQTRETLEAKSKNGDVEGVEHEFVMYPGAHHGFAVRADEEDKEEAERGKQAEKQAVDFFTRWFAKPPP